MVKQVKIDKYGVPNNYVRRELEEELERYLSAPEILAIVGPRQCGKSTMIHNLLSNLENKKKKIKINRIGFDNSFILNLFESDIDNFISKHVEGFDIVFIDEIQYSKDSGKKLKYIYDMHKVKLIISGSSAAEISIQSLKYLVGRILTFTLHPFSFSEFLFAKEESLFKVYQKDKYGKEMLSQFNKYLEEYLLYGGYPRVVLLDNIEEKKKILQNIYSTLLLKEIKDLTDLSENKKLINLLKGLSLQTGNLVDYTELSNLSEFDSNSVKKVIKVLEETFICLRVGPYFKNKRNELYKTPKIYFYDSGLRNISIKSFDLVEKGKLYENFIFSELIKKGFIVNFWRTKSKAEVDFVIERGRETFPIEIKAIWNNKKITRSFSSFLEKYSPKKGYFLSESFESKRKEKNTEIIFLPLVKFILDFK